MSHWNYRIVKKKLDQFTGYAIHEVYYLGDEIAITEEGIKMETFLDPFTEDTEGVEDLRKTFEKMKHAFESPILDFETRKDIK